MKYALEFSKDGVKWHAYTDTGITKHFIANSDQETKVTHWFTEPFETSYVRLFPLQWSVGVCMRMELYGCELVTKKNCIKPLGMESGKIPLGSLTTKYPPADGFPDSKNWSRLNKVVDQFPNGWMASIVHSDDWLEIDLGSWYQVTAIGIQGGYGYAAPYVTKLKVSYTNDQQKWTIRPSAKVGDEFPGSAGGLLADMVYFAP